MEEREPLFILGIINWCGHYGKQYGGSSKNKKIELPYYVTIPLLVIYLKKFKTLIWKDIWTYVPYSIIYNNQNMKATYVSMDRWMDKNDVVHIYNRILLCLNKNEIFPLATT